MSTIYTVNNKVLKNSANDKWLIKKEGDPYNPLNLPPNTVRVRTRDGNAPSKEDGYTSYETATLVSGTNDVYDVYKSGTSFQELFSLSENIAEVIGANTTGITNMSGMFYSCGITTVPLFDTSSVTNMEGMFGSSAITTVPLFNTSNVTNMRSMFSDCSYLTTIPLFNTTSVKNTHEMFYSCYDLVTIPLFNTSSITDMSSMFEDCYKVNSGALALYQQASSQATPPSDYSGAFSNCGSNTQTGAAELAQIPSSWGGTGA